MSFNPAIHLNAEFVRNLRINLPRRRLLFIAGFTVLLLAVAGALLWSSEYEYTATALRPALDVRLRRFGEHAYWPLIVVLFGLLFVLAPAMTALSFIQERLRGTAIFQQMVLLKPFDLAVGKFLGSGLISYVVAVLVLPCSMVAGILGQVGLMMMLRLYLFLFIGGLCCQAVGLFVGSAFSGATDKALRGGMLVGPAVGFLSAMTGLFLSQYFFFYTHVGSHYWDFYGLPVRPYKAILVLLLFAGVWAFAGAVRQIKVGQLIPVGPRTIWLFFASAEILLLGLCWGRAYETPTFIYVSPPGIPPVVRVVLYLFFNWLALMMLAGSYALSRGRLREWWSAERDPFTLFQRREMKNALKTFLLALGLAETGLLLLWNSFQLQERAGFVFVTYSLQMTAIALAFALTVLGMAAFIQYCAMQRFRIGSPAGAIFTILFYLTVGVAGLMFESKNNTPALLNPLVYAYNMCEGERGLDYIPAEDSDMAVSQQNQFVDRGSILVHGLLAESILAAGCFGLAYLKWKRTREEILEER
jgi:hypothetical protein